MHTVLVDMQVRLARSDRADRIFQVVLDVAGQAGLWGGGCWTRPPIYDAVATMDTITLIRSAIRGLLAATDVDLTVELRAAITSGDDYASTAKPQIDWTARLPGGVGRLPGAGWVGDASVAGGRKPGEVVTMAVRLLVGLRWAVMRTLLGADSGHGPLPALLLVLTVVTGVVDAVSILELGRVFVANMTGNVVFIGFALAGAAGFSLGASLSALAGFLAAAALFGMLTRRIGGDRAVLLLAATGAEVVLVATALVITAAAGLNSVGRVVVAALLAVAMGAQNTAARRLAVPDLTTTVLTMTLTGIAADLPTGTRRPTLTRRLLAVATMLTGAAAGTLLVLRISPTAALALATTLLALVTASAAATIRTPATWRTS